jgi:hypothetical protein
VKQIFIYWENGAWRFDEPSLGIHKEPFVLGSSEIITEILLSRGFFHPHARRFGLRFSARNRLPYTAQWIREDCEGSWYTCPELEMEGWLRGKLDKFFHETPKTIYFDLTELE